MKIIISQIIAKLTNLIFKLLGIGSGTTWPGYIVLSIFPNILNNFRPRIVAPVVIITGTNGKTTTSKILTSLLSAKGYLVLNNLTGANLINGIVSTLLIHTPFFKPLPHDFIVLEVDEFALPLVLSLIPVDVLVLLNLSRDQLDRYGETDIILSKWQASISLLPLSTKLVVDASQTELIPLNDTFAGNVTTFDSSKSFSQFSRLKGTFNAKNINASMCVSRVLGFDPNDFQDALSTINPAYGRGETIDKYHIYLAKNPASFDHNLMLLEDFLPSTHAVLIILNDNIPDGRDVSWIYDIDVVAITNLKSFADIFVSGSRCFDMAVRLSYAGIEIPYENINPDIKQIRKMLTNISKNVIVFPNYSGMLSFRKLLTGRAIL